MAMTREESLAKMREINRRRYANDPVFRAKCLERAKRNARKDENRRKHAQRERMRRAMGAAAADDCNEQYSVRVLEDETVWFGLLAGERYEDASEAAASEGVLRMRPAPARSANSSMAWTA